ncbi:Hermansky-Pudlak syndrome 3 protein-like [Anneissia japonica]|uniref:Hermansky-Pudlak syndrome 3 protein-like n=1 Tax=Anneissia japonica TaxID=1529436 RepID=UPI0014256830|nr:Hermansky-Pudlak syndrome 3 protein-like [Anneissia japonica]XP_033097776.1 Hermansky-Pudlak syndrome 3 protein-like [Anneissia japonica]XP_033097777.1 Hermansky-Pudlak syndrome 3 protein-like [Anneissia japonica]XP_033097778.1 Hermansky-Pudlak syndrome 3 protein-like [Anneissia japonica]
MVQVYSCHHFSSQEVFTSQYEPIATCSSTNLVFVATSRQTVETHDMTKRGCPLLCTFSTVGVVLDLAYSEKGNFVAALESKSLKHRSVTSARVYMNWAKSAPGQPGRVRVAGHSIPSKKLTSKGCQFEVIEIPTFNSPTSIKCCSLTGNIVIGVDTCVCLFHFQELGNDTVIYDFERLMNIDVGFTVIDTTICCNYLSCISQSELQIFKLNFTSEKKSKLDNLKNEDGEKEFTSIKMVQEQREKSFFVEDEYFVSWSFNELENNSYLQESCEQNPDFETLLAAVKLENLSANKTCLMPSVQQEEVFIDKSYDSVEVLGPLRKVKGHPIKIDLAGNLSLGDYKNVVLTTLIYRRFETTLNDEGALHSLQFCSTISPRGTLKFDCGLLGSNIQLAGLCCFVSTQTTGILYEIHPQIRLLALYPYTAESSLAVIGRDLLHAVTKNGLETYTTRSFAAALLNSETVNHKENTCPPATQEPSLIGLRPFIGIFAMAIAENHLIMLSKDLQSSGEGSWGTYVLKDALIVDLYNDIIDLANRFQTGNVCAYLFLLEEAHLVLRSFMFHTSGQENFEMIDQYKETCRLLGDHYAGSDAESPHLALPYYNMSQKKLSTIIKDQHEKQCKQKDRSLVSGRGLLDYLDYHLFDQSAIVSLDECTAAMVLTMYVNIQPERLSNVILESKLVGYSLEGALQFLEDLKTLKRKDGSYYIPTVLDSICQAVIQLKLCEPDQARFLLNPLSDEDVTKVFVQRPWLLIDDNKFSSLAQLMRQHNSKLFVEVLIALHDNSSVGLETALQLFEACSTYINPSNTHLRDYLEVILNASHRKSSYKTAANLLAEIYIQRLNAWKPAQSRVVKGRGHVHVDVSGYFGSRYGWLDDVLPFAGKEALRKPCSMVMRILDAGNRKPSRQMSKKLEFGANKECHCCCCYQDLIKAQSLLCTKSSDGGPHKLILEACNGADFIGSESLKLLCLARLNPGLAANFMLDKYPHLLVVFVKDVFGSDENLWKSFLEILFKKIRKSKLDRDSKENLKMYSDILKGVLDLAVSSLNHTVFISVLPNDGALSFFLPYIERCCYRLEASKLRSSIAADLIAKTEMI